MAKVNNYKSSNVGYDGNYYNYQKHTPKQEWAGVNMGDGFNDNIAFHSGRSPAQRLFYKTCREKQIVAANLAEIDTEATFKPQVKPQLALCYTDYPALTAAWAAIGHTALLEFKMRASDRLLATYLEEYLKNPAKADDARVDPRVYKEIAKIVTDVIQNRLILEELSRNEATTRLHLIDRIFFE